MRYTKFLLAWVATLFSISSAFSADQYNIDPNHTGVGFSVRHMMVSNVKGKFKDVSGTIVYDAADITKSSVNVTIKTASITLNRFDYGISWNRTLDTGGVVVSEMVKIELNVEAVQG